MKNEKRFEQSFHQLLLKVNYMTHFLSGYLSVAASNLEPNASILTHSLLFWDLKGTCVISSHLYCVLVCPPQAATFLSLQTRTSLDHRSLHSPASLCLPPSPHFSVFPSFPLPPSLSPSVFFLSVFFLIEKVLVLGFDSFL